MRAGASSSPVPEPDRAATNDGSAAASATPTAAKSDGDGSAECEERWVFQAHGVSAAGDTTKYPVAAGAELVTRFYFKPPSAADVQLLHARAKIDNKKIVHHWVLGAGHTNKVRDGEVHGEAGEWALPFEGERPVTQGAQGATAVDLPADVGMRLPNGPDVMFDLEIHYSNLAGERAEEDATQVELCLTRTKRPIEAAMHLLGRMSFSLPAHAKTDITSNCVPAQHVEPVHILAVTPHMHLTGERAKVVLNRRSGERLTLLDTSYEFLEQRSYVLPEDRSAPDVVLYPGDTLTSTCSYSNQTDSTIDQGQRSEDEMCEFAVLAWPTGVLHNALGDVLGAVTDTGALDESFCGEL